MPLTPSHRNPSVERLQFWDASVPPMPRCHLLQFQASKSKVSDTWRLQLWVEAFGAPPSGCPLPTAASARRHPEVVARLLRRSANGCQNVTLPAVSTGSRLAEDLVLHVLLALEDQRTCRKHSGTATREGIRYTNGTARGGAGSFKSRRT